MIDLASALDPLTLTTKMQFDGWLSGYENATLGQAAIDRLERAWHGEQHGGAVDKVMASAIAHLDPIDSDAFVRWLRVGPMVPILGTDPARQALAFDFDMAIGFAAAMSEHLDDQLEGKDPHEAGERFMRELDAAVERYDEGDRDA